MRLRATGLVRHGATRCMPWWLAMTVAYWLVGCASMPRSTTDGDHEASSISADRVEARGVVIERFVEPSAARLAGLQVGDELLAWQRAPAFPAEGRGGYGAIDSLADFDDLVVEQAPRGSVRVTARRGGQRIEVTIDWGAWGVDARPHLPRPLAEIYAAGLRRSAAGDVSAAVDAWTSAARVAAVLDRPEIASWLWARIGTVWTNEERWAAADEAFAEAIAAAPDEREMLRVLRVVYEGRRDGEALGAVRHALEWASASLSPGRETAMRRAGILYGLGRLAYRQSRFEIADETLRRALALARDVAPHSLAVADTWDRLGDVAFRAADYVTASDAYRSSALQRRGRPPGISGERQSRRGLARALRALGELDAARVELQSTAPSMPSVDPGHALETGLFRDLVDTTDRLGYRSEVARLLDRALQLGDEVDIRPIVALTAGDLARQRWDLDRAEKHYSRVLDADQATADAMAQAHWGLGLTAWQRGALEQAAHHYRQAERFLNDIRHDEAVWWRAELQIAIGVLELRRGLLQRAAERFRGVLEPSPWEAAGPILEAKARWGLGRVAMARNDWPEARDQLATAVATLRHMALDSFDLILALGGLATAERALGHRTSSRQLRLDALEHLENKIGRRCDRRFVSRFFYDDQEELRRLAIDLSLEFRSPERAFLLSERLKAPSFLDPLFERRQMVWNDAGPLEGARRHLEQRYDRLWRLSMKADGETDDEARETLRNRMQQARWSYDDTVEDTLRESSQRTSVPTPTVIRADEV
ncbi:MAG: tetratricopeptide repeat protein, partial [Acidobacteriota bacterium]